MATALRVSASGGNSYTSCWMQQNCIVPFQLFQPLGKGKVTPLRLWNSFSLLNKQIHKQTWQSTRSNDKQFLIGCRACCTVNLGPIPWVFSPVLLMHSKLSILVTWSRTLCPAQVMFGQALARLVSLGSGRHCHVLPRQVPDPLILALMWPPAVPFYITASMEKLFKNPLTNHTNGVKRD